MIQNAAVLKICCIIIFFLLQLVFKTALAVKNGKVQSCFPPLFVARANMKKRMDHLFQVGRTKLICMQVTQRQFSLKLRVGVGGWGVWELILSKVRVCMRL